MANDQSSLQGLRPFVQPGERVRINYYRANTGLALYRFQPVAMNNSGQVQIHPLIAALSPLLGTSIGFLDLAQAGLPTNLTDLGQNAFLDSLSSDALMAVSDDINQLYSLEEDTGGTLIGSENSSGQVALWTYEATTGNTTTGVSTTVLDRSTLATGTGATLTLVRALREIVNQDGTINSVSGDYAKWVVRINTHQMSQNQPWARTLWPS